MQKTNKSIDEGNILSAIGAFKFQKSKFEYAQGNKEFKIIHLAHLDKFLYLMSKKEFNQK